MAATSTATVDANALARGGQGREGTKGDEGARGKGEGGEEAVCPKD